ncbi:uncharacterized protein TNCV_2082421 [Trichonephila clavipes]|nr:uncharacterized protein TNCV_2082421 [Trichonephila clavipes]
MIANYVNEQHDTWDQFLREFAYAIRTAVNETTRKTPAELFLGRMLITPFQKLVMVSDGNEFAVGDIERLFEEARGNTKAKHEKWEKYYNRRRRDVQIKVNDWVLIATHPLSSATKEVVAKFKPKFEGEKHANKTNKRGSVIRSIPSSWSEKSRRIKRSKKEIIGYKRSRESGWSGPERKIRKFRKSLDYRVPKRALSSNDSNVLQKYSRKRAKQDKIAVGMNRYNIRPRGGIEVESRLNMERKTQQGGPVRSRKGRGRNDSPYIEERTRSGNRNARRRSDPQREEQERKGASTRRSLFLEVLVGNANYKS